MKRSNTNIKNPVFGKQARATEPDLNVTLLEFERKLNEAVTKLIRKIDTQNLPRHTVYEIMVDFETFVAKVIEGLKTIVGPRIKVGEESVFNEFIAAIQSSMRDLVAQYKPETQ